MHNSDCILAATGETVLNRALINYYRANGGTGSTLPDLERSFLLSQGVVPGTVNGMWAQLLRGLGYTGTLAGMQKRFWCELQGVLANVVIDAAQECPDPGSLLTALITDSDGVPGAGISYQWLADGAPIAGATSDSYTLSAGEIGKVITVNVQYLSTGGTPRDLTSAPTCVIGSTLPVLAMAQVESDGVTLNLTFSADVSGSSGFTLWADGIEAALDNPINLGDTIRFTTQVYIHQTLRLDYVPGDVVDQFGSPLDPINQAPVINLATGIPPPPFTGVVADVWASEGVPIAPFSVAGNFIGPGLVYGLEDAPAWMSIDAAGWVTGTPTDDIDWPGVRVTATNAGGTTESNPFDITVEEAVRFQLHPISQLVEAGNSVTLAVIATGADDYQWYRNGAPVGVPTPEYTFVPTDPADTYFCRCTNARADHWDSNVAQIHPVVRFSNQVLDPQSPEILGLSPGQYTLSVVGTGAVTVTGDVS